MVKKENDKYVLYTKDGKRKLGTHDTLAQALSQEAAVNISKARKAGHRIPRQKK
jgi:hypothetical protein